MCLSHEQEVQLEKLINYRHDIIDILANIQGILQQYFPEEFELAYQHYIPQITTALHDEKKWLSRGGYSLQDTLNNLSDKIKDNNISGVSKYIK